MQYLRIVINWIPILITLLRGTLIGAFGLSLLRSYDDSVFQSTALGLHTTITFLFYDLIQGAIDEKLGITLGRSFGSKNTEEFKIFTFCGAITMLYSTLFITAPFLIASGPILYSINMDSSITETVYLMLLLSIPTYLLKSLSNILLNIGYCQNITYPYTAIFMIIICTNIGLLYLFTSFFNFGCYGIILSTLIADVIGVFLIVIVLKNYADLDYVGVPRNMRYVKKQLPGFIWDCFVFCISEYGGAIGYQVPIFFMMATNNTIGLDAYLEVGNLTNMLVTVSVAIAISYNIQLNQLFGSRELDKAKKLFRTVSYITFCIGCFIAGGLNYFSNDIADLYTSNDEVNNHLVSLLQIMSLTIPLDITFETIASTLRSLGKNKWLVWGSIIFSLGLNPIGEWVVGFKLSMGYLSLLITYSVFYTMYWIFSYIMIMTVRWDTAKVEIEYFEDISESEQTLTIF